MYCKKCGNLLTTEDKFCKKCGQPVEQTAANVEIIGVNNQPQTSNPFQTFQQSTQPDNVSTPNYQSTTYNQTYTKKSTNPILFGVIGVLCVGLIAFGVLFFIQKNDANPENNQVATDNGTKVNYSGYTFSIPADYITEEDDYLMVYDDTEVWMSNIGVFTDLTYTTIRNRMSELKENLESTGISVNSIQEKTINGNSWIIFEYTNAGYNVLGGYGKTTNNKVVSLEVLNADNTYDTNRFSEFEKICSSAKVSTNKGITNSTTNKGVLSDLVETLK